ERTGTHTLFIPAQSAGAPRAEPNSSSADSPATTPRESAKSPSRMRDRFHRHAACQERKRDGRRMNIKIAATAEHQRLAEMAAGRSDWQRWGTYVSERAWGTVREDYSADGRA